MCVRVPLLQGFLGGELMTSALSMVRGTAPRSKAKPVRGEREETDAAVPLRTFTTATYIRGHTTFFSHLKPSFVPPCPTIVSGYPLPYQRLALGLLGAVDALRP